ncbi:flagellar biosynthetic protein FliO [Stomatohabitans albus]|uniref:flagellar biosynthetic protein FliO n=1 Tax=Stomatohabitans albus TaxID=3110766 RepID=UPI00300C11AC
MAADISFEGSPGWVVPFGDWIAPVVGQGHPIEATGLAIRVVIALGVTAGLLIIITHLLKRFGYGGGTRHGGRRTSSSQQEHSHVSGIHIEQIAPLTRQAKVATISVDGHRLVVGVTDQHVSLLKDLGSDRDAEPQDTGSVPGELERYPIDPAVIRAAQLRHRQAD